MALGRSSAGVGVLSARLSSRKRPKLWQLLVAAGKRQYNRKPSLVLSEMCSNGLRSGSVALQNALHFNARGLILENTFSSIGAMGKRIYPWLPINLLLRNDIKSLKAIPQYKGPLLIIHGDKDEVIPYPMGEELYKSANEPKQFLQIPGGRHNDFPPPYYFIEMDRFIGRL